ncbi:MAG: hypothetical protein OXI05_03605 [Bacteroidota bacterium]|nr:hypothetical protein [Bacteroidota bacterium]
MLQRIVKELQDIGLNPRIFEFSASKHAVMFDIEVQNGRYKGKTLKIALSFQESSYPEYPPHFVHLQSSTTTRKYTRHFKYQFEGEEWSAYSLPPGELWDKLDSSQKNMGMYVKGHIFRIFANL